MNHGSYHELTNANKRSKPMPKSMYKGKSKMKKTKAKKVRTPRSRMKIKRAKRM